MTALGVKLTGRAARWMQLLEDFGHLDPDGIDRVMVGVADLCPPGPDGARVADLAEVRRAAAMVLFPATLGRSGSLLDEDWPLLFS